MSEPLSSIRRWIRIMPDPASEPTVTIALSSYKRFYVDLRIFHPTWAGGEAASPNQGGPPFHLDWAFAGTSISTPVASSAIADASAGSTTVSTESAPGAGPSGASQLLTGVSSTDPPSHTIWHHWIDSRTAHPAIDEGDMFPQPSGAVLEKGRTINPATGELTDLEELWDDEEIPTIGVDTLRVSCVLKLEREPEEWEHFGPTKGMVVRVGRRCHGLMITEASPEQPERVVDVERWVWATKEPSEPADEDDEFDDEAGLEGLTTAPGEPEAKKVGKEGNWIRTAKIGSRFLPCSFTFEAGEGGHMAEGHEVMAGEDKWIVVERHLW